MADNPLVTTDAEHKIAEKMDRALAANIVVSKQSGGVTFSDVNQVMEFAKMMAISSIGVRKHFRGNPGACLAVCVQAVEWGMSPYAVANKSYLVNDQIAYEAQLINAVILRRAPIKGRLKVDYTGEGDKRRCTVSAELRDEPGVFVEYQSPAFGGITPKNSPLWKSDPDQQLFYYSSRAMCRRHFPDVLLGVYARDELATDPYEDADEDTRSVSPPPRQVASLNKRLDDLAGDGDEAGDKQPPRQEVIPPAKPAAAAQSDKKDEPAPKTSAGKKSGGKAKNAAPPEENAPPGETQAEQKAAAEEPSGEQLAGSTPTAAAENPPANDDAEDQREETREEAVRRATMEGRDAAHAGKMRRSIPESYNDEGQEHMREAWIAGHKSYNEEASREGR